MNLLPIKNLSYRSGLKSGEIIERLSAVTEAEKNFTLSGEYSFSNTSVL
ncbi:MAG: hypothetical protein IPP15_00515 [Saprospiraceae bacterium]|uniref:Uncharacterized protein n=1 Tax=Candidatus Opimibacter skivensis TaxID=2982028 RepID=A0A9D7SS78_9BACT|nr:hypothetical protein [Candidatus Opimibacter skivensis]